MSRAKKAASTTLAPASRKKARARARRAFRQILVPLDFTERDDATLATALLVADASEAATTLLHVVYVPDEASRRDLAELFRELSAQARAKLERHAEAFLRRRLPVEIEVVLGRPLDEILERARRDATDLIVLSSHPVEPERPVPGWDTLSYKVAALCRCPVLLAK